jgi:PTS system mannose-specific IIB component
MIKLVRLDYRLLHGQVCFTWVQHVSAHRVIIVDNASATDDLKKSALKLAKPQGVRLNVFTCEQIMAKMPKVKALNENIIIIFGSVHDLATFAQAYPEIGEVNYGATANRAGATQLDQSVFLLPSEMRLRTRAQSWGRASRSTANRPRAIPVPT